MGIVLRQTIKGTIVNYLGIFVGFFTTFFVLTRFLTQEEIGLTRMLVDVATLFSGLAQLGMSNSIIRFFPYFKDEENRHRGFFFWTLLFPFLGFVIFACLYLLLKPSISGIYLEKSALFVDYYYYILPLAFALLYQIIFEANATVLMRIVVPRFIREVLVRVLLLGSYLLYAFKVVDIDVFVALFCCVYVFASLCNIFYLLTFKSVSFAFKPNTVTPDVRNKFFMYSSFLLLSSLVGIITPRINTFFISAEMGLAFTGIYTIAEYISTLIEIPSRSLNTITGPILAENIKNSNFSKVSSTLKLVSLHQFLAGGLIFFLIWTNIDLIFSILPNGENYLSGKWVVLILGISKLLNSSVAIVTGVLSYSKYYMYTLVFTLCLTVVMIVFITNFIPIWGITGASLAMLFSYLIYYILFLAFVFFKYKISIFSYSQIKTLFVFAIMFLLDVILREQFAISENILLSIFKGASISFILTLAGGFMIYKLKVSDYINSFIDKFLNKI